MMICGLCGSADLQPYFEDVKRQWPYFLCSQCDLVFRDPKTYLGAQQEKERYETHNNNIENEGYVRFLSPVVKTLLPYLQKNDQGLDFGSGPGPILDILFSRQGFEVFNYDPYFAQGQEVLKRSYDFVTCTEVFEHLYKPSVEMGMLSELVSSEGFLLIMSEFRKSVEHFARWGYRTDNTHVCFLSDQCMQWIANQWGFELLSSDGRLSLLRKKS